MEKQSLINWAAIFAWFIAFITGNIVSTMEMSVIYFLILFVGFTLFYVVWEKNH